MTHHYLDLGSASDWSCRVGNVLQPIKSTTQFWVVTLINHKSSDNVVKSVLPRKNNRHPSSPPPPLHLKLGYWLFPTVLSSTTSTKLHGGGRGGKATFFLFEVGEMSEALEGELSQLILSLISALPDINWNSKC